MPLNFVQPMGHINSLNNKILYGKTGELCSSLLYTSRVQGTIRADRADYAYHDT